MRKIRVRTGISVVFVFCGLCLAAHSRAPFPVGKRLEKWLLMGYF
jgi:hypothetical protein